MVKTLRTFITPSAAVIAGILLLAPFLGGQDSLTGVGAVAVLALAAFVLLVWSDDLPRLRGLIPLAVFIGLLALSAAVTVSLHATISQTIFFAACVAAALTASAVLSRGRWLGYSVLALLFVGVIIGCMAINEYRLHGGTWRVFTTFLSPGYLGGYLTLIIPVTLAALVGARSPIILVLAALAWALEFAALFLTGTRAAVGASLFSVIVFLPLALWSKSVDWRRMLPRLAVALLLLVVVGYAAKGPTEARVTGPEAAAQTHSWAFRVATWQGTARIVKSHPLLGTGAGTFEMVFPKYRIAGPTKMAHNSYLEVASEAGIPALIAMLAGLAVLIGSGFRGLRREDEGSWLFTKGGEAIIACGMLAALAGSLMRNLTDSDIMNGGIGFTFWILAGAVASRAVATKPAKPSVYIRGGVTALVVVLAVVQYTFMLGQMKYDSAEVALQNGRPQEAYELYSSASRIDPLRSDNWLRLGQMESLGAGEGAAEYGAGLPEVRRAIKLEPTRAKNYIVLGRMLVAYKQNQAALEAFQKALSVDPHATPAMLQAARLMNGGAADDMYARMLREETSPTETLRGVPEAVNPDYAWAHFYFGDKYLKEGRRASAANEFRAVIERLEKRKSYKQYLAAMTEVGAIDPEEEKALDTLLSAAKDALARSESGS